MRRKFNFEIRTMLAVKQKTSRPHAEHRQKKTNSFTFLFLNRIRTACKQCSSNVYISVFNLRYPVDVLRHCNLIEFSDYTLVACNNRSFRFTETHPSFWIIPRFLVSKYIHYYITEYIFFTSNERKQLKTVTWELSVETCNTPIFYKFSANSVNCQIFYDNVYNSQYTLYSYIYRVSNIFEP